MTTQTALNRIGALVGAGLFFEHVSARAAFKLPAHHDRGLVKGSGARSHQPGSHVGFYADYFANERATNWNGYDTTALLPASGTRILLDVLPSLSMLGPISVRRTAVSAHGLINSESEAALSTPTAINDDLLPLGNAAVFPAFDLFASALHLPEDTLEPGSFPGIKLIDAAEMTSPLTVAYPTAAAILPKTKSGSAWAVWAKLGGNTVADSGFAIWADSLTAGK